MNLGRPLEFDPDEALNAAMDTFWSQGYEGTSLQDLLKVMDLSKSSFYQAFGSKQALFEQCIERYRNAMASEMLKRLKEAPSARQFIQAMLNAAAEEARSGASPKGCLVMNTANEFAQRDPAMADCVRKGVEQFTGVFKTAVKRAQAEGDLPADQDPVVLARYLVSSMSGIKTLVKAGASEKAVKDIIRVVLRALD